MASDLRLPFLVRLRSPLAISSGRATAFADAAVARSPGGRPIIPATAIKGAARDLAALIPGLPKDLVDLAFGGGGDREGVVTVSDAELPDGAAPQVEEITTVALSEWRTARPARLATVEAVLPLDRVTLRPLEFHGAVYPAPQHAGHPRARAAMAAWACGLVSIRSFGGRTRRGWGQVEVGLEPQAASAIVEEIDSGWGAQPSAGGRWS